MERVSGLSEIEHTQEMLIKVGEAKDCALADMAAIGRELNRAISLEARLERKLADLGGTRRRQAQFRGHEWEPGDSDSGMCVTAVAMPDDVWRSCGEPRFSPIHDPSAHLAYQAELNEALRQLWGRPGVALTFSGGHTLAKPGPY